MSPASDAERPPPPPPHESAPAPADSQPLDTGRALYRSHVEIRGLDDPATIDVAMSLIAQLQEAGHTAEATVVVREVQGGLIRAHGADGSGDLRAARTLARSMEAVGDHEGALELQRSIYDKVAADHGANSRDAFVAMEDLAHATRLAGDPGQAREVLERVLGARVAYLGTDHPETVSAMHELSATLYDLDEKALAGDLEARATSIDDELRRSGAAPSRSAGASDPTAPELESAASALRQAHDELTAAYGEQDPRTGAVAALVGRTLLESGEAARALPWFERATSASVDGSHAAQLASLDLARTLHALDDHPRALLAIGGVASAEADPVPAIAGAADEAPAPPPDGEQSTDGEPSTGEDEDPSARRGGLRRKSSRGRD